MNRPSANGRSTSTPAARVRVSGYVYLVDFGAAARPRFHAVGKDRTCHCPAGPDCSAVKAVRQYLRRGGERAPDPPEGYWPFPPRSCPVCGAETHAEPGLNSPLHDSGWRCFETGLIHYFWARSSYVRLRRLQYVAPGADHITTTLGETERDPEAPLDSLKVDSRQTAGARESEIPSPHDCPMCGWPTLQFLCSHDCEAEAKFHAGW